jgi:hypothetical protein
MKRLLFAFSLLTATFFVASIQRASAQAPVTTAAFTAMVNQLDSQIGSGDTTSAKATFATLNTMMIQVLGVTKSSIHTASDAGDETQKTYYTNYLGTQQVPLYRQIWHLKTDLVTNHSAIITKLNSFGALIY